MNVDAWHLPWGKDTVPHGLLDIIRGCNITCKACYNSQPPYTRPLPEIERDLDTLMARRRVGAISLVGGEVLLHPDLCDIVRMIRSRGLSAHLFTNGVLLDDARLAPLKEAGIAMIVLHIERGQTRPDLPPDPSREQLRALWEAKTGLVASHGIDVGLAMTAFEDTLSDVRDLAAFVIDSPCVTYGLVTLFRDVENFSNIRGDVDSGLRGERLASPGKPADTLTNRRVDQYLRAELNLRPFAYLGSSVDRDDPRWLSYLVATRRCGPGAVVSHSVRPSALERGFLALSLRWKGKYPMYRPQNASAFILQLILNGFAGGDLAGNLRFLAKCCRPGSVVGAKRILLQRPAEIREDGTLVHCINCPDAVVRHGRLVPVCISDKVVQ